MSPSYEADIVSVLRALVTVRFFLFLNTSSTYDGSAFFAVSTQIVAAFFLIIEFLFLIGVWRMGPDSKDLMRITLGFWSALLISVLIMVGVPIVGGGLISMVSLLIILAAIVPSSTEDETKQSE